MRKLQLEDLAVKLGVSKTLISMVLNGKGNHYGISKKTQATVLDAIAKLNYSPNRFAKSLRTGKSFFIGLIVADISNPFYSTIAKNIEGVLFEKDYTLMVCSTEEIEEREKLLVDMMVNQQGVDGLIISSTLKDPAFYEQTRFANVPIVFIDRLVPKLAANYVITDNLGGARNVVNQLIKQGNKRIACFAITPLYLSTIADRVKGYKEGLAKHKIEVEDELIKEIHFENTTADVERALRELPKGKKQPDAIFALNNNIAVAVLHALRKKEFSDLSDLQVACFDDIETFNIIEKKVLSVSQPVEEIGKNASALLMDVISGKRKNKTNVVLETKLVVR